MIVSTRSIHVLYKFGSGRLSCLVGMGYSTENRHSQLSWYLLRGGRTDRPLSRSVWRNVGPLCHLTWFLPDSGPVGGIFLSLSPFFTWSRSCYSAPKPLSAMPIYGLSHFSNPCVLINRSVPPAVTLSFISSPQLSVLCLVIFQTLEPLFCLVPSCASLMCFSASAIP